jgi:transitional endoplasmic reticulum ATPase
MNGYKINDDYSVNSRIDADDNCDIYSLKEDKGYLYLFKDLKKAEVINSRDRYKIIYVKTLEGEKLGVISDDYSRNIENKIRKEITELVGLDSVAGMKALKELLINEVINPLLHPEKYTKFKLGIPNGILLYGPPGCGKTYTVRKLAEELGYNYIEVKAADVSSPYIHGGVEKISRVFDRARAASPSILFFDEIEGLVPNRDGLGGSESYKQEEINQFLAEMNDSGSDNILVVGATNRPHLIDTAILRSGRMDRRILIPPPDKEARKEIIKMYLMGRPISKDINYSKLTDLTENYVTSDIELIIEDSARMAVKRDLPEITQKLIEECVTKTIPSVSPEELEYFESIKGSFDRV